VITGGRVVEIRDGFVGEGNVVDLRQHFVLPGLIDSHVHLTSQQNPNARLMAVTESDADRAILGAQYARRTLMAGFTTVADLGGPNDAVFALRDGIAAGQIPGPRVIASGSSISIHGGHGDVTATAKTSCIFCLPRASARDRRTACGPCAPRSAPART
jgi:imidazolonepropionase-like amidohydrolase